MKTRFGAGYGSYLLAIAWPLTHVLSIVAAYAFMNHVAPLGDEPVIFVATAAIPYMLCLYPGRLIGNGLLLNKPFLNYNTVKPLHIISARCVLEFVNVAVVVVIGILVCYGIDSGIFPMNPDIAAEALAACVLFGISFGVFNAAVTGLVGPLYNVAVILLMMGLYFGSLPLVPPNLLSQQTVAYLKLNPLYDLIEWLRSAYYVNYDTDNETRAYVTLFSLTLLLIGLSGERFLRGRLIS
jgi:capsular polysaccharide transport system permease protein